MGTLTILLKHSSTYKSLTKCTNIFLLFPLSKKQHSIYTLHFHQRPLCHGCYLSMNGCRKGHSREPVGTIETQTLEPVATTSMALYSLKMAISKMKSEPQFRSSSGIVRLQVSIEEEEVEAIDWLHSQNHLLLPRCFFSGREHNSFDSNGRSLVSVAGVGSAVFFCQPHPFSYWDWVSIRRFLSESCPLIRAYGAIRFDAKAKLSVEWLPFGSFYFMIPQVHTLYSFRKQLITIPLLIVFIASAARYTKPKKIDRLSLMSLKEDRCSLRPLRGTIQFLGHGKMQSMLSKTPLARFLLRL
ncbi:hypothetical protein Ahy_B04g072792 isoform C [Arachis hypogaea]|uniref:Uncharacterized protein n=1 Tax=Arachis hypogaea TaxID=3818 RepID=A0A444ZNT1_ARAHY|nr:hypothetical protein Ahy_B04g072792 isoform C [Arachis hypogaea]